MGGTISQIRSLQDGNFIKRNKLLQQCKYNYFWYKSTMIVNLLIIIVLIFLIYNGYYSGILILLGFLGYIFIKSVQRKIDRNIVEFKMENDSINNLEVCAKSYEKYRDINNTNIIEKNKNI